MTTKMEWKPNIKQGHYPALEMDGVEVTIYRSQTDLVPCVQITTPEDSDIWEVVRVYFNDGEASGWK